MSMAAESFGGPGGGLLKRRRERREAMSFARERVEFHLDAGRPMDEATDLAMADAREKFGSIWETILPVLLEFFMKLIEEWLKNRATQPDA